MQKRTRPNLIIIGAMKSGSTSLHSYLGEHPQIFMCEPKEPWYFIEEINWSKGEEWYLNLFESAGDAKIIGESSTDYTKMPKYLGVPDRILQFNPHTKFIYIMRDPIKRTISHYWHNVRWHGEKRDPLSAIKEDSLLLDVSNYAMQLTPYIEIFGKENIYTLTFEKMLSDPAATMSSIFSWLDVESSFHPPNIKDKMNVTPNVVEKIKGSGGLHQFRHSKLWNILQPYFPKSLITYGRNLAVEQVTRKTEPTDKIIDFLRPIQQKQVETLCDMLGCEFPEWTTLFGR